MNDSRPKHTDQSPDDQLESAFLVPKDFRFGPVTVAPAPSGTGLRPRIQVRPEKPPPQPLGPLEKFTGTFQGNGFNVIFVPQSTQTPAFDTEQVPVDPDVPRDNVLQLNITEDTLSFSNAADLASVPNRGMVQGDIFFAGVAYIQSIKDITGLDPDNPGIHFEPGLWMSVPATSQPPLGKTVLRMASIPHGTTIVAQGDHRNEPGPPKIPAVSINPTDSDGNKIDPKFFPSLDAENRKTARLPQDLTSFIGEGTITQEMLDNPNSLLEKDIKDRNIISTTTIDISTDPLSPLKDGGAANMAFLLGKDKANPNAQTLRMQATFWIETVEVNGITSTQIQYSQQVFLNFNGLTWPHVSVATLRPKGKS